MDREPDDQISHEGDPSMSEDEQGTNRIRNRSSSTPHSSERSILQKPAIPPILRSSSGPVQSNDDNAAASGSGAPAKVKRSSILKKKRQDGHGPTVSFELDPALSRAKSSDSNLSFESETGYWSGGSGGSGILKGCKSDSESSSSDGKSILKQRRASLGNLTSEVRFENDAEGNELHSILKRKLSYDSSVLLNSTKSSQFSLSTNSLPADMSDVSPEPKPILKNKYSSDEQILDDNEEEQTQTQHTPRPILKNGPKRNGTRGTSDEPIRPILKRSAYSFEKRHDDQYQSSSGKGILKRSSSNSRRQSVCSDTLDPDDFDHETAVGFMLNRDDGLESKFRHSESPHRRAGSTTPRSESEEEIMLGLSLAEKRSVLMQMESASVDRGSKRGSRVDRRLPSSRSDRNSPYRDLDQLVQAPRPRVESPASVEIVTTLNTKGQLLSSILGQISDSHDRKQHAVNFDDTLLSRKACQVEDTEEKANIMTSHSHSNSGNIGESIEKLEKAEVLKKPFDSAILARPIHASNNDSCTPGNEMDMDLELHADRLSLNDHGELK